MLSLGKEELSNVNKGAWQTNFENSPRPSLPGRDILDPIGPVELLQPDSRPVRVHQGAHTKQAAGKPLLAIKFSPVAGNIHPINLHSAQYILNNVVFNNDFVFPFSDLERKHSIWNVRVRSIAVLPVSNAIPHPPWCVRPAPVIRNAYEGRVELSDPAERPQDQESRLLDSRVNLAALSSKQAHSG